MFDDDQNRFSLEKFAQFLVTDCKLQPDIPIVAGVSGGKDSIFLLQKMHQAGFVAVAAHFNHKIRASADQEALFVRQLCADWEIEFTEGSTDVPLYAQQKHISLEEAARICRYQFLFAVAAERSCQAVCTAHHADDQAETVLMHFLRGAGVAGLAGMRVRQLPNEWSHLIPLVRPLLMISRAEISEQCTEEALPWIEDASNDDPTFLRNRIRLELLPLLEQRYNPAIRQTLLRNARAMQIDADWITAEIEKTWQSVLDEEKCTTGGLYLEKSAYLSLPEALRIGILRKAAFQLRPDARNFDQQSLLNGNTFFSSARSGKGMDFPHQLRLFVEENNLIIAESKFDPAAGTWPQLPDTGFQEPLPNDGTIDLGKWMLSIKPLEVNKIPAAELITTMKRNLSIAYLDRASLTLPLTIRCAKTGERFSPQGMDGQSQKLSDFWINRKLPRSQRVRYPVISDQHQIVWLPLFQAADAAKITTNSKKLIEIRLIKKKPGLTL